MKKILLVLGVLFLVLVVGLVAFVATFNVDHYRPLLVNRLSEITGEPVEIQKITLGWSNGAALAIKGVRVFDGPQQGATPFILADEASAEVDLNSLLHGRVEVSAVRLEKPFVRLVRNPDGTIKGLEKLMSGEAKATRKETNAALALAFFMKKAVIEDATIIFRDEGAAKPAEYSLEQIDVLLSDVALERSVPLQASARLYSGEDNVQLNASLKYSLSNRTFTVEGARLSLDLAKIDPSRLAKVLPDFDPAGFPKLRGRVNAVLDNLTAAAGQEPVFSPVKITLEEGYAQMPDLPALENLRAEAQATPDVLTLGSLGADFAGGKIAASGEVRGLKGQPQSQLRASLTGLDLTKVAPVRNADAEPWPSGILGVTLELQGSGLEKNSFLQTLAGQGQITLRDGTLHNVNVIRDVFQKLSILPGLLQRLKDRLPPSYQERLERQDTRFAPVQTPFVFQNQQLHVPEIAVMSDEFALNGPLDASFDGMVASRLQLRIEPQLSEAMIRTVNELQYLTNGNGELELPVVIQGKLPQPKVMVDLQYIGSRLATAKTQELLGSLFQKKQPQTQQGQAPQQAASPAGGQQVSPTGELVGELLNSVFGGGKNSSSQPRS
ncbi:MAG TPA: AsmA family protein [Verrucomicrobiae bacterium]|nr:AsmA family protein [Verrucomicrobiae bacterium]